jgi:glycosyltransferase involved in cell wall biosynthesis
MRGRVTHISLDGLSTALGQSQVLALSERLQSLGWRCTVLSLEPTQAKKEALEQLRSRMASSGVEWHYRRYRRGSLGALKNAGSALAMMREIRERTDLFHCRSYFGAFFPAAWQILREGRVPYVFDTRGYWVDEKIQAGRWFQDIGSRAIARRVERELYERASGVVSLTELAAEDVRSVRFGRRHSRERVVCIPTCVDYRKFTMERVNPPHDFLNDGPIVAYVGSLNPSYEYRASLEVATRVLRRNARAKFLAMTSQVAELSSLAEEYKIPTARRLIREVPYDQVHLWLPWVDAGLMLLVKPNRAKRASMPTKLAEFLATGVAPIGHGANSEFTDWVRRTGSGLVLDDLSSDSLDRAADFIVRGPPELDVLARARVAAEKHFSLDSGVERYDALFQRVLE